MVTQNAVNLKVTNNADGFDISGGTTARKLTVQTTDTTISASMGYTVLFAIFSGGNNPADATTYYVGYDRDLITSSGLSRIWVPHAGTIKTLYGVFFQSVGSNENSTLKLRNNGLDIYTISTTLDHSAANTTFSATGINQAVVAGDWLELSWATPTWTTNPTNVRLSGIIWIEY